MVARRTWSVFRRVLFWGIPAVLLATVVWTFLPHGHVPLRAVPPKAAPQAGVPPPSSASPAAPGSPGGASPSVSIPPAVDPPGMGVSAEPAPGAPPFAEIRQGDLEGTDETGRQQWRIVADVVTVVHDKDVVLLRNVKATLFERNGGTIVVTGAQGRFDTKSHEVEISGSVHGKSSTGRELFADQVRYMPRAGKLTGTGHIRLIQGRVVMYADGMTSDTTLGRTQFFGNVHASVR
jgi:LPS export ABC transporter protein LptC